MADSESKIDPLVILGSTGLKRVGGLIAEEWHPKLSGSRGIRIYKEMKDNDAIVGAILYVIESLAMQAPWTVKASGETTAHQEAAQFVQDCLTDMSHSWEEMLTEIFSMLWCGWAYFEVVYKWRSGMQPGGDKASSRFDDGRMGWRKISLRDQETLSRWEFDDDGGIRGMWQVAPPRYAQVYIPIEKALLFRPRTHKNNPEGRSLLRSSFRSWYFLKRLQEIEAVGMERDLAGLPIMEVPPEIMHPNANTAERAIRSQMERLVQQIRRDEREGLVIPSETDREGKATGYKLRLLSSGGKRALDIGGAITRYEQRIAMTLLAQFILLGQDGTGSFALSSDQTNLFSVALGTILDSVGGVFNRHAIPRLMALNAFPEDVWPTLQHGDVEAPPLTDIATYINTLVGAQVLTPDEGLEDHLRAIAKLPARNTKSAQM